MPRATTAAVAKVPTARKGAAPRDLTPEYVEGLKLYADVLFKGGLAPKGTTRPEGVAALIEIGRDLGISATQAIAGIKIIGGRPGVFGDLGMAMIRGSGLLEWVEEKYEGEPGTEGYTAICRMKRIDVAEVKETRFSIFDAMRANLWLKAGPWTEYPERMLMWRARSWSSRDLFPDVLMGLTFLEELQDIPTTTPRRVETTTAEVQAIVDSGTPGKLIALTERARDDDPVKFLSPGSPDAPAATATPTAPEPPPDIKVEVGAAKLSEQQLTRLVELRAAIIHQRGIADDEDAIDSMWGETLADYDVTTARDLTGEQAHELIADITKALAEAEKAGPKVQKRPEPVSAL